MATSFLDKTGLTLLWAKIKATFALKSEIPDSTSDLTNDSGFITDAGVTSFNGATGDVTYSAVTYTLSISNNVIALTGSDGSTSSITLPVYNGGVSS